MKIMTKRKRLQKIAAFTLLEATISMAIFTMVGMAEVSLIIITAQTQNRGFVTMRIYKHADHIQDKIYDILQNASREAGVFFDTPNGSYYRKIIFKQGPDSPNESLSFNADNNTLTYDPDMNIPGNELIISYMSDKIAQLDEVGFRAAMKAGGLPDSAIILVNFKVSDHGKGKITYRDPSDEANWITSRRTFAVGLRRT
jgi:hypothetical protein